MIKKITFIAFLFLSFNSFGQDIDELRKKASTSSDSLEKSATDLI